MEKFLKEYSKWLDETKEHLSNQAIAAYSNLNEVLSDKEKQFIENHLKSCSDCRSNFVRISAEDKEMDELSAGEEAIAPIKKSVKIFTIQKLIRYSAAAVILIALAVAAYYVFIKKSEVLITENNNRQTEIDTSNNEMKQDTTKIPKTVEPEKNQEKKPEKISTEENFAANDLLENFINRNVRSETKIKIVYPGIGDTLNFPITFKWDQSNTTDSDKLIIVDNKNKLIYLTEISGKEITIDKQFDSGLYYWKLEVNGKLEAVGKFYFR